MRNGNEMQEGSQLDIFTPSVIIQSGIVLPRSYVKKKGEEDSKFPKNMDNPRAQSLYRP